MPVKTEREKLGTVEEVMAERVKSSQKKINFVHAHQLKTDPSFNEVHEKSLRMSLFVYPKAMKARAI